jgi:hypothetical protein
MTSSALGASRSWLLLLIVLLGFHATPVSSSSSSSAPPAVETDAGNTIGGALNGEIMF